MPATDYNSLQAQLVRWSGGSSDANYAEAVRDCIRLAEVELDRTLWTPERVVRRFADFTAEREALPDDCGKLISILRLEDDVETDALRPVHPDVAPGLIRTYSGNRPLCYALEGAQIRLIPKPTVANPLRARWIYYALVPRLSDASACTAILTTYPDVYLYTSLKHLAPFSDDPDGIAKWGALSAQAIAAANRAAVLRSAA